MDVAVHVFEDDPRERKELLPLIETTRKDLSWNSLLQTSLI